MFGKHGKSILILLIGGTLILNGCANSNSNTDIDTNINEQVKDDVLDTSERMNREDKPIKKQSNLVGIVKQIIGNEVTIDLVDASNMAMMGNRKELSEEEKEKMKDQAFKKGQGGRGGAFSGGEKPELNFELIGETKVIIIPVGTSIVKQGREGGTELDLTEINKGTVLMIQIEEGGNGEIDYAQYVTILGDK